MQLTKMEIAAMPRDPLCGVIGAGPLRQHLEAGDLDGLLGLDNWYGRHALLDADFRGALMARCLAHIMSRDRDVAVSGLHDLRILVNAAAPAWLNCLPDELRWIMCRDYSYLIDSWHRALIQRVAQMTPAEYRVWRYFFVRSVWLNPTGVMMCASGAHNLKRAYNGAWDWRNATSWEGTTKDKSWGETLTGWGRGALSAVTGYVEEIYDGADYLGEIVGDEYGDEVRAASTSVVKAGFWGAELLGIVAPPTTWQERYIPDPLHPGGYRVVRDYTEIEPLARFGEAVITGIGDVDDSLRELGLGKSARLATMAIGSGVALTGVAAVCAGALKYIGAKIKGVFVTPPPVLAPVRTVWEGIGPISQPNVPGPVLDWLLKMTNTGPQNVVNVSGSSIGELVIGGTRAAEAAGKLGLVAKLGGAGLITAGLAYAGNIVFAYFLGGEVGQTDNFTISGYATRRDPEAAQKLAGDTIKKLERMRDNAVFPWGGILAGYYYVQTAIDTAAVRRTWSEQDQAKMERRTPTQRAAEEGAKPPEAREEKPKKSKEQKKIEWTAEIKQDLIHVFLQLRAARLVVLKHKRLKLGEAYTFDTVNVPLIRTWINRERGEIAKSREAAQAQGEQALAAWIDALNKAGYPEATKKTDVEGLLETKYGFKPYKKYGG